MFDLVEFIGGGADLRSVVQALSEKKVPNPPKRARLTKEKTDDTPEQLPHVNELISSLSGGSTIVEVR